jgi:hypothetical protein
MSNPLKETAEGSYGNSQISSVLQVSAMTDNKCGSRHRESTLTARSCCQSLMFGYQQCPSPATYHGQVYAMENSRDDVGDDDNVCGMVGNDFIST